MANNLRPPSSISDLRTAAHMVLSARLESLDLTPLLIYTLGTNIPTSILPYLIWQYDMMIPGVAMVGLGVTPLAVVQNALPLHKIMGTPASIINALALCGYAGVTLSEGQASWGGSSYPASQGWAVFRVNIPGIAEGALFDQPVTGLIDSANTHFTISSTPDTNSLRMFYNGQLLRPVVDFSNVGTAITTNTFAPLTGETLSAAFRTSGVSPINMGYATTIVNFFKPARCLLDSITSSYPEFFDANVPTVSGSTLTFPQTPVSLEIYRNGLYQTQGVGKDYTMVGAVATMTVAPGSDSFVAWGTFAGSGPTPAFSDYITPAGIIDGTNKVFTLPTIPSPAASLRLYLGAPGASLLMSKDIDYTLSGATITYIIAPSAGSAHTAFYRS
jgi:P2-related tail formation protein